MRAEKSIPSVPRSDLVRQRRQVQSVRRTTQTREAASRAARSQPVTVRSDMFNAARPLHQTSRSRVKRQFYYSLGTSGAELRLPALPFFNPSWRVISAIIAMFSALAIYALGFSTEFQVADISVDGITRVTAADIEAVLDARGTQIVAFDSAAAEADLARAFPELTNINIQVGFPAKVHVMATELQPSVAWRAGEHIYWIDQSGVILPPRGEPGELLTVGSDALPPLLPLAAAELNNPISPASTNEVGASPVEIWGRQIDPNTLKRIIDLQSLIPPESKLVYNSLNGLGWEAPSGLDVYIGRDLTDFDLKLSMYDAIIKNLEQQGIAPQDMISVEFINAPFYR